MSVNLDRPYFGIAAITLIVGLGASVCLADEPLEAPTPEGLVITEIMYNPEGSLEFPNGQWFELYNPGDDPVTLANLHIDVYLADENEPVGQMVVGPLEAVVIPAHGFSVLGSTKALAINGGVPVDFGYGPQLVLPKEGGRMVVAVEGNILDDVVFGPYWELPASPGVSLNLEPEGMDPEANDVASHWCMSSGPFEEAYVQLYGSPGTVGHACDSDGDGIDEAGGDCDDNNPQIAPGLQEKCNDIDDNCNGDTDEDPLSGAPVWQYEGVCLDGGPACVEGKWEVSFPEEYEDEEVSCDYVDNDCDGETDEELRNECDECGHVFDLCDGHDNDCDGEIDEDADTPPEDLECMGNLGVCKAVVPVCSGTEAGWGCTQFPREYEPDESICDGLDNDCDGEIDEGFDVGQNCKSGQGVCRGDGVLACSEDGSGVVCQATPDSAGQEMCGNNFDDDCDGETDEGFEIGTSCSVGVGACEVTGKYFCNDDGTDSECSAIAMDPSEEVCLNNIDDDCDGDTDESPCLSNEEPSGGCGAGSTAPGLLTILLVLSIPLLAFAARLRAKTRQARSGS